MAIWTSHDIKSHLRNDRNEGAEKSVAEMVDEKQGALVLKEKFEQTSGFRNAIRSFSHLEACPPRSRAIKVTEQCILWCGLEMGTESQFCTMTLDGTMFKCDEQLWFT